jgi:transposase
MDEMQGPLFTTIKSEDFVSTDHPLRPLVNQALRQMNGPFSMVYTDSGQAPIAPERLLLQSFHSVRGERMLMEQIRYSQRLHRFVDLVIEDTMSDHSLLSKNCDHLHQQ